MRRAPLRFAFPIITLASLSAFSALYSRRVFLLGINLFYPLQQYIFFFLVLRNSTFLFFPFYLFVQHSTKFAREDIQSSSSLDIDEKTALPWSSFLTKILSFSDTR